MEITPFSYKTNNYHSPATMERNKQYVDNIDQEITSLEAMATHIYQSHSNLKEIVQKYFAQPVVNAWIEDICYKVALQLNKTKIPHVDEDTFHIKQLVNIQSFVGQPIEQLQEPYKSILLEIEKEAIERIYEIRTTLLQFEEPRLVFIDTETTGIDAHRQVLQVTMVMTDLQLNIADTFNYYVQNKNIPLEASNINGLTTELLEELGGLQPQEAALKTIEILSQLKDYVFVGHNVSFDVGSLNNLLVQYDPEQAQKYITSKRTLCTIKDLGKQLMDRKVNQPKEYNYKKEPSKNLGHMTYLLGIMPEEIRELCNSLNPNQTATTTASQSEFGTISFGNTQIDIESRNHNALYDTLSVYLLCKKSGLLNNYL